VNRQDRFGAREELFLLPAYAQLSGSKTAGPIVTVQHLRRVAQPREQSYCRPAKKSEPFKVIDLAINLAAREIKWRVNQIGGRGQCFAVPDANARTFTAPLDLKIFDESAAQEPAVNLIIERGDEKGISACLMQGLGQCRGNIGEAASLGKRDCFR